MTKGIFDDYNIDDEEDDSEPSTIRLTDEELEEEDAFEGSGATESENDDSGFSWRSEEVTIDPF